MLDKARKRRHKKVESDGKEWEQFLNQKLLEVWRRPVDTSGLYEYKGTVLSTCLKNVVTSDRLLILMLHSRFQLSVESYFVIGLVLHCYVLAKKSCIFFCQPILTYSYTFSHAWRLVTCICCKF